MASGWQGKLTRVAQMDWEELRVRLGQELQKRSDLLKYSIGVRQGSVRTKAVSGLQAGQFFFKPDEIPGRVALLDQLLPEEARDILQEADQICGHRFRLLGYENLRFAPSDSGDSNTIDWHLDAVHGKRAPLIPWFKIPFLDFDVVGDHKVTWELNRHQHLVTLAKARLLSGDEKYSRELMAQWRDWIKANPYPLGINWGSTLEVAFRSLSWIWLDQLLSGVPECVEFRAELAPALAFHGRYIERYLSTYFSPNTHLLGEAVALFFLGTLYPQMPRAEQWQRSGWNILLHEAGRQVRQDGVYFEQSLHYHVYALDFFLYARLLAARNEIEISPSYDAVLRRMLDVVAALAQAGPPEGFGDDDGGRLWNPRRNQTAHTTDPLALGAMIFGDEFSAARLTEEAIWLFGSLAAEKLSRATIPAAPRSLAFPDGGIYVLADNQPFSQTLAVDAGPQGVGRSGHGHADSLSLRLTMDGRRWLVDSGSNLYIAQDPADRDRFRGTAAHNTLRVDGQDQAVAGEPFSWTEIPTARVEDWIVGESFTYFAGSHNGYTRLIDPVVHRREVLNIIGGIWLVRDVAHGNAAHELEIHWHFAPHLKVRRPSAGRVEISQTGAGPDASTLNLLVPIVSPNDTIWHTATEVGKVQLSPAYGALQTAPSVRSKVRLTLPAEIATAILPQQGQLHDPTEPRLSSQQQTGVQVYELDRHNERHSFFFALDHSATRDNTWVSGPWSSDARVLYCCMKNQKMTHLVAIGGSHVSWQGQPLLHVPEPTKVFEWNEQSASTGLNSLRFRLTELFARLTGFETRASHPPSATIDNTSSTYAEKH